MTIVRRWIAPLLEQDNSAIAKLASALAPSLRALIGPTRESQSRILEVAPDLLKPRGADPGVLDFDAAPTEVMDAEILTDGVNAFSVLVEKRLDPRRGLIMGSSSQGPESRLTITYIGPTIQCSHLEKVLAAARDTFKVPLARAPFRSTRFKELRDEGRTPPPAPSPTELAGSTILGDRQNRSLALAIKSSGGLLVSDLAKQLPPEARERVDNIRQALEASGLIEAEVVVVCTKTQAQVTRVASITRRDDKTWGEVRLRSPSLPRAH